MIALLSNSQFRTFWLGGTVGDIAGNMWFMAAAWVLLELTDSAVWVGMIGINAVPAIILAVVGGGLADRMAPARLLTIGAAGYSAVFLMTAILVQLDVHNEWHIIGLSLLIGTIWAFQSPATKAIVADLVDRSRLVTANALSELSEFMGEIAAPLLVGFLIASWGAAAVFWPASVLILIALALWARLPRHEHPRTGDSDSMLRELQRGLQYMRTTPPFTALLVASTAGLFGAMLIPLVPVVARDVLDAGASGFGVLSGAFGAGLAAGSATLLVWGERGRKSGWLIVSSILASSGIAGFAFAGHLGVAVAAVFVVGFGTAVTGNMIVTIFQISADDSMRGRAMGVYSVTSAMLPLGTVIGGWLGAAWVSRQRC